MRERAHAMRPNPPRPVRAYGIRPRDCTMRKRAYTVRPYVAGAYHAGVHRTPLRGRHAPCGAYHAPQPLRPVRAYGIRPHTYIMRKRAYTVRAQALRPYKRTRPYTYRSLSWLS